MKTRAVYLGVEASQSGRKLFAWGVLPENFDNKADPGPIQRVYFDKHLTRGPAVGFIYEFERDGATWIGGDNSLVQQYFDDQKVAEWQARHRAVSDEFAARSRRNKELTRNLNLDSLIPARKAYQNAGSPLRRRLVLAQIIEYITNG